VCSIIAAQLSLKKNCYICELEKAGSGIFRSRYWTIDNPDNFKIKGLLFVRLRRHAEELDKLKTTELESLGITLKKAVVKSREASKASKITMMRLGLKDPHFHFWVVPKTPQTEKTLETIRNSFKKMRLKYAVS